MNRNEPAHTPGPWAATKNPNGSWAIHTAPNYMPHASVFGRAEISARVAEADARLIAAAPELLEACQMLINAPHQDHFASRLNEEEMSGIRAIIAAISNATKGGGGK